MGRPEKQISPATEPALRALVLWLRAQRQRAGLTYQQMAKLTGHAHSTLSRAAQGNRVPRLRVAEAYAHACQADVGDVRRLWRRARQAGVQGSSTAEPAAGVRPEYVSDFSTLHTAMTALRHSAGVPSLRELAQRAGGHGELPRATLQRIVSQQAIPSRHHLVAFAKACGVSGSAVREWSAAWDRASGLRTERATALAFAAGGVSWPAPSTHASPSADTVVAVTRLLATGSTTFKGMVEMEQSVLRPRSSKLFTLSALYYANQRLLDGVDTDGTRQLQLTDRYWEAVDSVIPAWKMVRQRSIHASEVRRYYIHSYGIALRSLGEIGNVLLKKSENPRKWTSYLERLATIDWARTNPDWEGRALLGGRVAKSFHNATLTTAYLRQQIGLPLSTDEQQALTHPTDPILMT